MCISRVFGAFVVQLSGFNLRLKPERTNPIKWGCSSAGRAPALQAGGQGFDSLHLHQFSDNGKSRDTKIAVAEGREKSDKQLQRTELKSQMRKPVCSSGG